MNQIYKFWPASLAHLTLPYLDASSQYVTIAEISSERANGYLSNETQVVAEMNAFLTKLQ